MLVIDEFDVVYESGHTTTYCSGEKHVILPGGWAGNHVPSVTLWHQWEPYECDCEAWDAGH